MKGLTPHIQCLLNKLRLNLSFSFNVKKETRCFFSRTPLKKMFLISVGPLMVTVDKKYFWMNQMFVRVNSTTTVIHHPYLSMMEVGRSSLADGVVMEFEMNEFCFVSC